MGKKLIIFILSIIVLILLEFYFISYHETYKPGLDQILKNQNLFEGIQRDFESVIQETNGDKVVVRTTKSNITIHNVPKTLQKGQYVKFLVEVNGGELVYKDHNAFEQTGLKIILSIFAVFYVIFVFFKEFKITKRGFTYA